MPKSRMAQELTGHVHPEVPGLIEQVKRGEVDRREFIRTVTLLGVSAATAYSLAGLTPT